MNTTFFIQMLLFLMSFSTIYAQDIKEKNELPISNQDKFIISSQTANQYKPTVSSGVNSVFIQQIGTYNKVSSTIRATASDINILQKGDYNTIEFNESAREIEKQIVQSGNSNTVKDFSFNPDIATKLELVQKGDNLTFERFGSNELSKNIKYKMTGKAKTIIIRSF
ncbi:hypothetical protein [Aquimarina longa]|uniref:hypothetical protein n=1 Tax=Aquimarina longa TaxID=1080221 RepID=UPI000785320F|nr:hypothetical protein [Aquimarina longa]